MVNFEAEDAYRRTGRSEAAEMLARARRLYGDVSLNPDNELRTKPLELPPRIQALRQEMEAKGFRTYQIGGLSMDDLSRRGLVIDSSSVPSEVLKIDRVPRRRVVAIPPVHQLEDGGLLKGTFRAEADQIAELMVDFNSRLAAEFPGTELYAEVPASVLDVLHVAWEHHNATGVKLLDDTRPLQRTVLGNVPETSYTQVQEPEGQRDGAVPLHLQVGGWHSIQGGIGITKGGYEPSGVMPIITIAEAQF